VDGSVLGRAVEGIRSAVTICVEVIDTIAVLVCAVAGDLGRAGVHGCVVVVTVIETGVGQIVVSGIAVSVTIDAVTTITVLVDAVSVGVV